MTEQLRIEAGTIVHLHGGRVGHVLEVISPDVFRVEFPTRVKLIDRVDVEAVEGEARSDGFEVTS